MNFISFLWHYWKAKNQKFASRDALEAHQQKEIAKFIKSKLTKSPYFSKYVDLPLSKWPLMNKAIMMENFDQMNTAGLKLQELLDCAFAAEKSRDFEAMLGEYSVGLSSGTSNIRGIFVASAKERQLWASHFLAKCFPNGLLNGERAALFLRANNKLYSSVNNRWISLKFFDLFAPFESHINTINTYQPTMIVAPAQVLESLAKEKLAGRLHFSPRKVFSAAEVLEPLTKELIIKAFGSVSEIYQATEGFLGITCEHGTMHLNEEVIYFEKEWLDDTRFVPIITDFVRSTQPIVRYRLDDVLAISKTPCPCGSHNLAISRIEGRFNDVLKLPNNDGKEVTIFADLCSRVFAQNLPIIADYQLIQENDYQLKLFIDGGEALLEICRDKLNEMFAMQGVDTTKLHWTLSNQLPERSMTVKKRRIQRVVS